MDMEYNGIKKENLINLNIECLVWNQECYDVGTEIWPIAQKHINLNLKKKLNFIIIILLTRNFQKLVLWYNFVVTIVNFSNLYYTKMYSIWLL